MALTVPYEIHNKLQALRQQRGFSAIELAARVGVTRQTVHAMERNSYVPNTLVALRLAEVLGVQVESIFQLPRSEESLHSALMLPQEEPMHPGQPVQLCRVGDKLVGMVPESNGFGLPASDGTIVRLGGTPAARRAEISMPGDLDSLGDRLLLAGCDPAASLLWRHMQRSRVELLVKYVNSTTALHLLQAGTVHVAGTHLPLPPRSREVADLSMITMASWDLGLAVSAGNPKGIRSIADLARRGIAVANRETGSGARRYLDSELRRLGIATEKVRGYDRVLSGHIPVARSVAEGVADCGLTLALPARTYGLEFVPLTREHYNLFTTKALLKLPAIQTLFDVIGSPNFRRELQTFAGYDTTQSGVRSGSRAS